MKDFAWNPTTIMCYERKFKCEGCDLDSFCRDSTKINPYKMRNLKYRAIKAFAQNGEPKEGKCT